MTRSAPSTDYATRLEACYTGAVYDVLRALGRANQVLPSVIRPLDPERSLAGKVFTISGRPDPSLDAHTTLLEWTALLSKAPSDSVVVCQPNDRQLAHMGELSAETLTLRNVRGYVFDGGCRDTRLIRKLGFRVWCRYHTPRDVVGRWAADGFGEPVEIGGVVIHTGDYLLADADGVIIVPADLADEVLSKTEQVLRTENKVRSAILKGVDPQQAYLLHRKF